MITKKYYKLIRVSHEDSEYLRLKNISNDGGIFKVKKTGNPSSPNLEYSLDGINWSSYDFTNLTEVSVPSGSNIYLRGTNYRFNTTSGKFSFDMDKDFTVGGNVASIINKTNPELVTSLETMSLNGLFAESSHIIHAKDMTFGNITNISGDNLELWNGAIATMFYNCVNLQTPPNCSSFTRVDGAIAMFRGCSSLQYGIDLSNVTSVYNGPRSLSQLYYGCSSLYSATAPNIQDISSTMIQGWLENAGGSVPAGTTKVVNVPTGATISSGNSGIPTGWTRVDY